jgi:hypothetical protein
MNQTYEGATLDLLFYETDLDKYDIIGSVRKGQQLPSSPSSRVTVVTGSQRGIGLAITKELVGNIDATAIVCTRLEEVAKLIACLASNNFSFATGNTMIVDGGTVLLSFTW